MRHRFLTVFVLSLISLIAILNAYAIEFSLYWSFWWFDILMHFLGGLWVALVSLWGVGVINRRVAQALTRKQIFLLSVVSAIAVGVGWELFEYLSGMFVEQDGILLDTIIDLIMDTIGGIVAFKINTIYKNIHG